MSSGRVARNFLALASGDSLARVIAFGGGVYVARQLGAELYGIISFATAVLLYFAHTTECGMDLLGLRDVAEDESRAATLAPAILTARLVVAVILIAVVSVVALAFLPRAEAVILSLYTLTLLAVGPGPKWVLLGLGNPRPVALGRTIGEACFLVLVLTRVRDGSDLVAVPLAQATGDALGVALMLWLLHRTHGIRPLPKIDWAAVKPVFARSWPLVANVLLGLTIYNSDLIFLRIFRGRETVGHYNAAYQLISFLQNIATAFSWTLLPQLTRVLGDRERREELYHGSAAQVFAVGLPIAVGGHFVAANLIDVVYGSEFEPSGWPLALLVLSVPFTLSKEIDLVALVAGGRQHVVMKMTGAAMVVNLALNVALIPRFGIIGAAIATLATEVARAGFASLWVRSDDFPWTPGRRFAKSAIAGAAMGLGLWLLGDRPVFLQIPFGAAIYTLGLWSLGGLRLGRGRPPQLTV